MLDTVTPEHVIAVPKISWPSRPPRAVLSEPQMAEQLVEVPTVVSPSFLSQSRTADIPVPGARGVPGYGGLQGFLPEQSSFPSVEQITDIPVPGRGVSGNGVLQGFHSGQGPLQRTVEQIVDIPVLGGGPQDFLPDPGSVAPSAVSREELFQVFFRTFPRGEKRAKVTGGSSARVHARSSSSTSAVQRPSTEVAYEAEYVE